MMNIWMTSTGRWTQDEEHLMEELYPTTDNHFLSKILDRSVSAIEDKASRMDLKKTDSREPPAENSLRITERGFKLRTRKVKLDYVLDTRKIIENAITNLQELAGEAHTRATAKYLSTDTRQKWARIETYIYQTINTLTKNYDSQQIAERLEELNTRVEKLMEEAQEPGDED